MRLDVEMRPYRRAAKEKNPTNELLRAVRQALGIPVKEITKSLGIGRSVLFSLEQSEARGTISLNSMERVASAMGCKLVYAIVPRDGETLEGLVERRSWESVTGAAQGAPASAQGSRAGHRR